MSTAKRVAPASPRSLPSSPPRALSRPAGRRSRRLRSAGAALLGAMTFVVGVSVAQGEVGGVSPAAAAAASPTLRPGASGPAVVALQRALGVPADGAYGGQTRRAVRRLQRKKHMKADGVARPSVLRLLGVDAHAASRAPAASPVLEAIAQCESGGNPRAVSASGRYRGKYQFSFATWRQLGGKGDPAAASEATQDRLAARLYAAQGLSPWPHCGAQV